uniref:Uncharacterized protein n=1 Tax=Solanum lycopersicum TaxID=4081 RepID=A0A3Q7HFG1_SOLLC
MASMGVDYAYLQVQQKRLKEKLKKMEEENARSSNNEGNTVERLTADSKYSKSKKIYPDGFVSFESNENLGKN